MTNKKEKKENKVPKQFSDIKNTNINNQNAPETSYNLELIQYNPIVGKQLCLNMIVKNESRIIRRLLESVANYIDCYCICDTGSTDNTIEIIQEFFSSQSPPIPGRVIKEAFRDFGHNRSFALKACESIDVKYILLMDADMVLQVNPTWTKDDVYNKLTDDVYYIFQGSDTFYYKNVRVVKNKIGMSYWGVTHEYVKTPQGSRHGKFEKDELFINDIGDGGCKSDKFERDVRLLLKGLEEEPGNDRYTFYLANSYRDAGQSDNAIETYKKRIALGGWFDEVWHSYYSIGKCYRNKGEIANAIYWWMEGYNFFQNRIENLYEIIYHYRTNGKNALAYEFYLMADKQRKKHNHSDYLFLQKDVYDYKLDYELSIIGYYCNHANHNLKHASMKVLNYPYTDKGITNNVLNNYKFYAEDISKADILERSPRKVLKSIGNTILSLQEKVKTGEFVPSTPSICLHNERLVVNVRFVNYKINSNGGYENPGSIETINVIAIIDIEDDEGWIIEKEFILNYDTSKDNLYVGLEDVRLYSNGNLDADLYFNANRGLSSHNIKIEHGIIDLEKELVASNLLHMDGEREVEKNWVMFEDDTNTMKGIYGWSPLIIGDICNGTEITNKKEFASPHFFNHLRGSTNGVRVKDEIWFICHTVSYEDRRYYYHIIVALDPVTYEVKRYTPYFTFEKEKVEYTLGLVYFKYTDELMISYSLMDKSTNYNMFNRSYIDNMMFRL
jgi:tetratricopeptide (TPR) repeat protein